MILEFEDALTAFLKEEENIDVRPYLEDFDNKKTLEGIIKEGKNIIFINFNSDEFISSTSLNKVARFSLFYVGATAAIDNSVYISKARRGLLTFIEKIDKKIPFFKSPPNCGNIELTDLTKIKDGISELGYLLVYERGFQVTLYHDEEIVDEI